MSSFKRLEQTLQCLKEYLSRIMTNEANVCLFTKLAIFRVIASLGSDGKQNTA